MRSISAAARKCSVLYVCVFQCVFRISLALFVFCESERFSGFGLTAGKHILTHSLCLSRKQGKIVHRRRLVRTLQDFWCVFGEEKGNVI